jgi:hypothetical protein
VSELISDRDWWAATRYPDLDDDWAPRTGRHAYNEEAAMTPIYHALSRGGWRGRQHEPPAAPPAARAPDPIEEFRRDPLTAPIPVQAMRPPAPRSSTDGYADRPPRHELNEGRHHRRWDTTTSYW